MVYTGDLKSPVERHAGSSPAPGTKDIKMKLYEATIRVDGKEFKDRVGANSAEEARMLLQQRHGPRAVPFIPHMIPS
jgi:hypothetical protein